MAPRRIVTCPKCEGTGEGASVKVGFGRHAQMVPTPCSWCARNGYCTRQMAMKYLREYPQPLAPEAINALEQLAALGVRPEAAAAFLTKALQQ